MPHDLDRFVSAQAPVYAQVVRELGAGRKTSHWMWYVFPQLAGLGRSDMARRYAIASLDEARAYLAHPLLGARLRECTALVVGHAPRPLASILGEVDAMKFRSSMTLFALAAGDDEGTFREAIDRCCDGVPDEATVALLAAVGSPHR